MNVRYYMCESCGNLVSMIVDSGVKPVCCGIEMAELEPEVDDELGEKHTPMVSINGPMVSVDVGSIPHPMESGHFIKWISIQTEKGMQIKQLRPTDKAEADFLLVEGDKLIAVYSFCSRHGLWKAKACGREQR